MPRVLLLGGTTEASTLARLMAEAGLDAVFSYAGRTARPAAQPLPTRIGGFGGAAGLARFLHDQAISHVIDATHPFAAEISRNAIAACAAAGGVPLLGLERPAWQARPGDRWTRVADLTAAAAALPETPCAVFLAIGRQGLAAFETAGPHRWLLRLVDAGTGPPVLRGAARVIARGPFTVAGDLALMRAHRISHLVAKDSGGAGAEAKLVAARQLGVRVILIDRPVLPPRAVVADPAEALDWLHHASPSGSEAGAETVALRGA
ncbi:cobalt-precorrin-6A reductase [Paracoccus spongiarum]|uniref:Cobalt-precorrin-6A reductase n=1 Tax=Paracoccus spongiarum TaxID=3064387 RepID=A0ABT9JAS9_9RHOB|nr:cobalt-precorrin-6A reductase [Paracoccus sp. 2205BS29-5]MDP5306939.1 cobalt-precorrin-6A reductase [Paracoccus sp. 2205BS29-5]